VYRVAADSAGRKVKCRHCQAILSVPAPVKSKATVESGINPGKKDKTEKRKRKKARAKDWASMTLEERLGLTDEEAFRPMEIQRGLRYLAYGLGIMIIGGMLTYLLYELAKDRDIEWAYGILSMMYKVGGVWGPVIVCTIIGLIPCALGILNLMGIGIVVWDDSSPLWGTRSGGRKKGKSRGKSNKAAYIGVAGVLGVAFIGLVIFLANRGGRQEPPGPQAANPKVPDPGGKKPAPPKKNKPPEPFVEGVWDLAADPLAVPAQPWTLPEVVRIGIREKPVLAANNGPFLLTVPPPAGGEGEIWDLRKAQPVGKISVKAYLHRMTRLSADGKLVASLLAEHSGGSSFVTLWRPGQPFFKPRLTIPGRVMWFDFGASADELLILTRTETKDPKDAKDHLQVWSIAKLKVERMMELHDEARPPRLTGPALTPATVSPGGKYVALLADKKVALVAVKDGRLLAHRSLTDPGDLIQGGLWFSDDGAELTGIFRSYRAKQFMASRLQGWKMADGESFVDTVMGNNDVQGPLVPGPEPGTVFLTGTALNTGKNVRQGYVVELKSGAQVFAQPLFVPLRWLADGRLFGYDVSARDNKPSMLQAIAFDREKFKAAAGSKKKKPAVDP
jgi:hypothetical protein